MNLCNSPLMNQLQNLSVYSSTSNLISPQTPASQVVSGASIQKTSSQPQSQQSQLGNNISSSSDSNANSQSQQQQQTANSSTMNMDHATAYAPKTEG